jgi:hypothetical protein
MRPLLPNNMWILTSTPRHPPPPRKLSWCDARWLVLPLAHLARWQWMAEDSSAQQTAMERTNTFNNFWQPHSSPPPPYATKATLCCPWGSFETAPPSPPVKTSAHVSCCWPSLDLPITAFYHNMHCHDLASCHVGSRLDDSSNRCSIPSQPAPTGSSTLPGVPCRLWAPLRSLLKRHRLPLPQVWCGHSLSDTNALHCTFTPPVSSLRRV